jgi:hypothetical protein
MTADQIRGAIVADPALHALVPNTVAIAAALSVGRTGLTDKYVTERGIMAALGVVAGEAFLAALEAFGAATLPNEHPLKTSQAGIARTLTWLKSPEGINVGDPLSQTLLTTFAALGLVTTESANAVKALALVPAPVSDHTVALALFADDGTLLVAPFVPQE